MLGARPVSLIAVYVKVGLLEMSGTSVENGTKKFASFSKGSIDIFVWDSGRLNLITKDPYFRIDSSFKISFIINRLEITKPGGNLLSVTNNYCFLLEGINFINGKSINHSNLLKSQCIKQQLSGNFLIQSNTTLEPRKISGNDTLVDISEMKTRLNSIIAVTRSAVNNEKRLSVRTDSSTSYSLNPRHTLIFIKSENAWIKLTEFAK